MSCNLTLASKVYMVHFQYVIEALINGVCVCVCVRVRVRVRVRARARAYVCVCVCACHARVIAYYLCL